MSELVACLDTRPEVEEIESLADFPEELRIEGEAIEEALEEAEPTHASTRSFYLLSSEEEIVLTRIRPVYKPTYNKMPRWVDGADTEGVRTFIREAAQKGLLLPEEEIILGRLIHKGTAAVARLELDEYERDETRLVDQQLVAGAQRAFEVMRDCNQLLTIKYARAYHDTYPRIGVMDFINVGVKGVERAVKKFDPERGLKFSNYAVWWIRQSMQRYAQQAAREIGVPINFYVKGKFRSYETKRDKGESEERVAEDLNLTPGQREDYDAAYITRNTKSLDAKMRSSERMALHHVVADPRAEKAFEEIFVDDTERKEELGPVYDALTRAFAPAEIWAFRMASDGQPLSATDARRVTRVKAGLKHPAVQSILNDVMGMENPWQGVPCADNPMKVLKSREVRIKEICAACPLLEACEAVVIEERPKTGMWAGMARNATSYHADGSPKVLRELEAA